MKTKQVPNFIIESIKACESGKYTQEHVRIVQLIQAAPDMLKYLSEFIRLIETAEEMNNVATDSSQNPQKKGMTWADYRKLTQSLRNDAKLLVTKAEGLTDKETADEAALRG